MVKISKCLITTMLMMLVVVACERDHLHYQTIRRALVRIDVDWDKTTITPNGVSAYVYDSQGVMYGDVVVTSNPDVIYLKLPVGDYTVVLLGNTISELDNVETKDANSLSSFNISAVDARKEHVLVSETSQRSIDEPDQDVVSYTLRDLHVDAMDINYHYNKPNLADYDQTVYASYTATMRHRVHRVTTIIYIDHTEYLRTASVASLRGMAGGYAFDADCTTKPEVKEQFFMSLEHIKTSEQRVMGDLGVLEGMDSDFSPESVKHLDMVSSSYSSFGMPIEESAGRKYLMDIRFYLYDNTYVDYSVDVTDYIRTEEDDYNRHHIIELALDPLPDGGGEPGDHLDEEGDIEGGSPLEPSVDDWVDVGADLPL